MDIGIDGGSWVVWSKNSMDGVVERCDRWKGRVVWKQKMYMMAGLCGGKGTYKTEGIKMARRSDHVLANIQTFASRTR